MKTRHHVRWLGSMLLAGLVLPAPVLAGEFSAPLQWANRAALSLPVSGMVQTVDVQAGQQVKQGSVMLSLDPRPFKARLSASQATVARYRPGRDEAKKELERAEELFDRTVLSQVELDNARIDYAQKEGLYSHALAEQQQAKLELEYSELKAPYDLIVVRVHATPGQTVINRTQATPLIDVAAANAWAVRLTLSAEELGALKVGDKVRVADLSSGATVRMIDIVDDGRSPPQYVVEIHIPSQKKDLSLGKRVKVSWP